MVEVESCEKGLVYEYNMKKQSPPPFLVKTYMLVEDPATDEVISWNEDGKAFVVWETADFSRDLLPTLFKHSNFSSFVRQLNTYGFRKVATSRWEFSNEMFRKGEKELLSQIRRKKAWSTTSSNKQPPPLPLPLPLPPPPKEYYDDDHEHEQQQRYSSSATSSSSEYNSLIDENKRLKKENGVLSSQLSTMKMKWKELLHLVTIYNHNNNVAEKDPLLNHDDEIERRPKLFGVRLECQEVIMERKRKRSEEISQSVSVFLSQSCK